MTNATKPARLVRWALELSEYDFEIKHRKGTKNKNADALSRLPIIASIINENDIISKNEMALEQQKDPLLQKSIMKDNPKF